VLKVKITEPLITKASRVFPFNKVPDAPHTCSTIINEMYDNFFANEVNYIASKSLTHKDCLHCIHFEPCLEIRYLSSSFF